MAIPWWPARERERARPAEPVSRDRVVEAALELLRAGGLDALSMRKVAAEVGVSVSTVYWWAGNKEQLLALVVDEIHGRIELPADDPDVPWTEQLRVYAENSYAVYAEHSFVLPIVFVGVLTGPHTCDLVECGLRILRRGGLTHEQTVAAHAALAALILGFVRSGPRGDIVWTGGHRLEELHPDRYPVTIALAAELQTADPDGRFRFALDRFLAGLDRSRERAG
ncbi:MAG TPA: TetR/AcrR family transcriptional regulator [Acidimicrobiia bacterium]|nr:TetR/AcrR family transcriptional regulator [Acidimicrobiia bacterium]